MFYDVHSHISKESIDIQKIVSWDFNRQPKPFAKYFSIGIHPWWIDQNWALSLQELPSLLNANVVGIGETGLDRFRGVDILTQELVFRKHIEISEIYCLPLIIHCVKSYDILLKNHKIYKPKSPWIVHGFRGKLEIAKSLWTKKIYTSFGDSLLYSEQNRNVFQQAPMEQVFFETDDSHKNLIDIYIAGSIIKNLNLESIKAKIKVNISNVFKGKL